MVGFQSFFPLFYVGEMTSPQAIDTSLNMSLNPAPDGKFIALRQSIESSLPCTLNSVYIKDCLAGYSCRS